MKQYNFNTDHETIGGIDFYCCTPGDISIEMDVSIKSDKLGIRKIVEKIKVKKDKWFVNILDTQFKVHYFASKSEYVKLRIWNIRHNAFNFNDIILT